ncbi:NACHT and WD repeat domain-containing protein [Nocardia niigatensis]
MSTGPGDGPDPSQIRTREELAQALTRLRSEAGLTIRQAADKSNALLGTISGWYGGKHVPTDANEQMLRDLLSVCGVARQDHGPWLDAVRRVRRTTARRGDDAPYRGLEPYRSEDAPRFFGREQLTRDVHEHVETLLNSSTSPRILVVIGASGSGKSSLLQAGLVPALREAGRVVEAMVPGARPNRELSRLPTADVVVIDQFEETWTSCQLADERRRFFESVEALQDNGTVFVLGLRADFFQHAAAEPLMRQALTKHQVLITPLTAGELRDAIVEPARGAGWTVDEGLVRLLLAEFAPRTDAATGHDVGALPLLSHALLETWLRGGKRRMTVADYTEVGGISGAIDNTAEAVFASLTVPQQKTAQRTFLRLVNVEHDTRTRRRIRQSDLVAGDDSDDDLRTVLDYFTDDRLLTADKEWIEISHETLIGAWTRLGTWVDDYRAEAPVHRRLTRAAQVWHDSGRTSATVLTGPRLATFQRWLDDDGHDTYINQLEREYMIASHTHAAVLDAEAAAQRRAAARRKHRGRLTAALVSVMAITVAFSIVTVVKQDAASRILTRYSETMAALWITMRSAQLRDKDPALSAQLALAAYRVMPSAVDVRSALLDTSAVHTPVRLLGSRGPTSVTSDPQGSVLATGASDGTIRLYRLSDGGSATQIGQIGAPSTTAATNHAVAMGPGGLLARAVDNHVELWRVTDQAAPQQLSTLDVPATVRNLVFRSDGGELEAGGSTAQGILRWDVTDPTRPLPLPELQLPGGQAAIAFSKDGTLLAGAGPGTGLRIWRMIGHTAQQIFDRPSDGAPHTLAVCFSPDGHTLATAGQATVVDLWNIDDPSNPRPQSTLRGFTSYVNDLAYSPDGKRLAAGSSDNTTRVWNTDGPDADPEMILPNSSIVTSVRFSADARTLATADLGGVTHLWPLPGPLLRGAHGDLYQTPTDASGTKLLTGPAGPQDSTPHIWTVADPSTPISSPPLGVGAGEKTSGAVAFSADGSLAAIGTATGRVYLWNVINPAHPTMIPSPIPAVTGTIGVIAFSPDGRTMVVASTSDPAITVWDTANPAQPHEITTIDVGKFLTDAIAFDPSGAVLAVGLGDGRIRLWNLRDRGAPHELPALTSSTNNSVQAVAFNQRNGLFAAASADGTLRVFDLHDPENPRVLSNLSGPVGALEAANFSPDGHSIVASDDTGEVWIWDITHPDRPERFATLTAYNGRVNDVAYILNGRYITGAGPDRVVRLWQTDPDRVVNTLCHSGTTPLTADEWQRYLPMLSIRSLC